MPRFNHVQHRVKNMAPSCKALPAVVALDLFTPIPVPLPPKPAAASGTEGKSKEGSPGTPEADRTPTGANGGAEPSTNNHKKDNNKKTRRKKRRVGRMRTGKHRLRRQRPAEQMGSMEPRRVSAVRLPRKLKLPRQSPPQRREIRRS